jgi:plasmid stability protein
MAERTTVRLPEDLIRRARRRAAEEGRTLTALIEDGVRRVLDNRASGLNKKRVLPRVSSATGGVRPGIDLTNAALQEMDDLEYAKRLRDGFA